MELRVLNLQPSSDSPHSSLHLKFPSYGVEVDSLSSQEEQPSFQFSFSFHVHFLPFPIQAGHTVQSKGTSGSVSGLGLGQNLAKLVGLEHCPGVTGYSSQGVAQGCWHKIRDR